MIVDLGSSDGLKRWILCLRSPIDSLALWSLYMGGQRESLRDGACARPGDRGQDHGRRGKLKIWTSSFVAWTLH